MSPGASSPHYVGIFDMESYWTFKAPPAPTQAPPDCDISRDDWLKMSPGFRREIWRDYERRLPKDPNQ